MVAPPKPKDVPLAQAVDRYIDAMEARVSVGQLSERTVSNYRADLRHFVTFVGESVLVDDVTAEQVDEALLAFTKRPDARRRENARGKAGQAAATQVRYHQSVSRFFGHAERQQWVQMSPMSWTTLRPKVRGDLRTARTSLSPDQAGALLRHGAKPVVEQRRSHERNAERDAYLIALLLVTGPRVSEVVSADTADFSVRDGMLWWRIVGKGGKARSIPLSPQLAALRDAYTAKRPEPSEALLKATGGDAGRAEFRSGRGGRMSARDVQRLLVRAEDRVRAREPQNAREITPHALRHTAATLMLAKGWDVKVVAQLLGHASISTTGAYLDAIPGELAQAVADAGADLPM